MSEAFEPEIVVFCCNYCSYAAADLAGSIRMEYPPNVKIIHVPCSGRVDPATLLRTLEEGADGVCVTGCMEGDCHYVNGNTKAAKRVEYIRNLVAEAGLEPERVRMFNISASDAPLFVKVAKEMTETVRNLGPNPIKKSKERCHP